MKTFVGAYSRSKQHVESEGVPLSVQLRLCDLECSKGMQCKQLVGLESIASLISGEKCTIKLSTGKHHEHVGVRLSQI